VAPGKQKSKYTLDLHALYEAAVQNVEADIEFLDEVYEKEHGHLPAVIREDFCGTASLAARFVAQRPGNVAYGTDLDAPTIEWGLEHRVAPLGDAASRVHLEVGNVLDRHDEKVQVQVAFNFSYCIFKERELMKRYLANVFDSLQPGGMFMLDLFGGTDSMTVIEEETERDEVMDPDGRLVPALTYTWEQSSFNPVTSEMLCFIHLKVKKGAAGGAKHKIKRAFTYDWRIWTLPELRDLCEEVGFERADAYTEGWDEDEDEGDGVFERVDDFDNDGSWIAYLVAKKPGQPKQSKQSKQPRQAKKRGG
jgi:hypothetical protein